MMALGLGLLALRFLPALPPVGLLLLMPVLGLMLMPFRTYPLAFFLFGLSWACAQAQWALDDRLALGLDGETRWVEGRVTGLPENGEAVVRFELAQATSRHAKVPSLMRLAWYDGPPVKSGERWRLAVKLKRPVGLLNPQAFDYEAWLQARSRTVSDWRRHDGPGATVSANDCWRWMLRAEQVRWQR
jgi:competence protein ComEC